jgi:RNA polymerase sigma factor (sigma-70 family)
LHTLLFRLTLRADAAEDLLQELFCKLATSDGFQRAANPAGFAYRTAANLAFDWRRANRRNSTTELNNGEAIAPLAAPLTDMIRREELEQTLTAIGELPMKSRDIIVLRYFQQESYESIAAQVGKTAHQVRAIAHNAIKGLRESIGMEVRPSEADRVEGQQS